MGHQGHIVIYEGNEARVEVRLERESVWLSLQQIADLFGRDKSVISRHLKAIFASGELERQATVAKNATVQREGEREVVREIEYFNLDAVISVGYRVNSVRATRFRQWATRVLREHLTRGYSLDRQRFERNAAELEAALQLIRKAAASETLCHQKKPPVQRRQQALRGIAVRGFSGTQRAAAARRRAGHQRRGAGGAGAARDGV